MEYIGITGKRFLIKNSLRLIHPEIIIKDFILAHHKENEDQFHKLQGRGLFSQEITNKIETIPMPTFARRLLTMEFIIAGGVSAEFYGWTAKTAIIGTAIRHIS